MKTEKRARKVFINPIYKDKVTVHKGTDPDGTSYDYGELEVWPGGGNTFHTHATFEETFTAVIGKLGVAINDKKMYLQPGESFTIPRNTPHHFFNDGNSPITCYVRFTPDQGNFIKGLAIAYGLAGDGKTTHDGRPKNFMHLALILKLTDTRPVGAISFLTPLFRFLAGIAERNGLTNELLDRYYYE